MQTTNRSGNGNTSGVLELRCAIRNRVEGKDPILCPTGDNQKIHLITRDSGRIEPGTWVIAKLVRQLDKCSLYKCESIGNDRMVVVGSTGFGLNETRVEYMGATMYYRETWHVYLKDIAEVITETRSEDTRHMYYLIRRGEEQVVIDSLEPHLDDREWYQFQCSHPWKMTKEEYDQHDSNLCPACKDESDRRNRELNQMMTDYGMPL